MSRWKKWILLVIVLVVDEAVVGVVGVVEGEGEGKGQVGEVDDRHKMENRVSKIMQRRIRERSRISRVGLTITDDISERKRLREGAGYLVKDASGVNTV